MNVGVVINESKEGAREAAALIAEQINAASDTLYTCVPEIDVPGIEFLAVEEMFQQIDALISLGGDGTMLHAVQLMGEADVPIIGINLGNLGFMTSVPPDRIHEAVKMLLAGEYKLSNRSRISVSVVEDGDCRATYHALNDVAIGWGASSRIIALKMSVNGEDVTTYACDGLIVSTPTGSTGHSLSAGGPILHPDTDVFVISPLCPHTLSSRPLVLGNDNEICVEVVAASKELLLAVDGQEHCCVTKGAELHFKKSETGVRFIHFAGYSYFDVLRQKLRWRGSSV